MTLLTHEHVRRIGEAAALMTAHGDVLSDFERETIVAVCRRFRDFRREAAVSHAEWTVVETAIAAMARELRADEEALAGFLARTRAA